jgi:hypothetical protein
MIKVEKKTNNPHYSELNSEIKSTNSQLTCKILILHSGNVPRRLYFPALQ